MFEHVGPKNYPVFFETVRRLLRDEGLFLLHTIGAHRTMPAADPWIDKYIFPNGRIPSARQIARAIEPHFVIEDWHNFGQDYDRSLMAWWRNFDSAWPQLRGDRYNERFYRMWIATRWQLGSCPLGEGDNKRLRLQKSAPVGSAVRTTGALSPLGIA